MKRQQLVLASLGLLGALCAGSAMARGNDDVQWSVTIGTPPYTAPPPAYRAPAPAYRLPGYTAPARQPVSYRQPTRWDRDGDGIADRYDRVYNPSWDRDGDGVPNRRDPRPDDRYDGHGRYGR